jgi:outer membrane protein assembly factor BamB
VTHNWHKRDNIELSEEKMKFKKIKIAVCSAMIILSVTACSSDKDKVVATPLPVVQNPTALKMTWHGRTGNGTNKSISNFAPALVDGTLYTVSQNGTVMAYDAKNGHVLWKQTLKTKISSAPTVGDDKLFVNDGKAELVALNASTGAKLYSVALPNQSFAAPAYDNGTVVVKTVDETLAAFNAADGSKVWSYEGNAPNMILQGGSSPIIDDGIVIFGSNDGQVTLVTLDKGQLLWQRQVVEPNGVSDIARMVDIDANPLISNNVIYVASYQGEIVALDKFKAQPIWKHRLSTRSGLVLSGSSLFVTDSHGRVWAFDAASGKVLWKQNQLHGRTLTAPVILGNDIVVADDQGNIHWLSQTDGHFIARVQLDKEGIASAPVASNNMVYVMSNKGDVAAYQL